MKLKFAPSNVPQNTQIGAGFGGPFGTVQIRPMGAWDIAVSDGVATGGGGLKHIYNIYHSSANDNRTSYFRTFRNNKIVKIFLAHDFIITKSTKVRSTIVVCRTL